MANEEISKLVRDLSREVFYIVNFASILASAPKEEREMLAGLVKRARDNRHEQLKSRISSLPPAYDDDPKIAIE